MAGFCFGGGKRDRTADLLNAIQTLYQLSYTPKGQAQIYMDSILFARKIFKTKRGLADFKSPFKLYFALFK